MGAAGAARKSLSSAAASQTTERGANGEMPKLPARFLNLVRRRWKVARQACIDGNRGLWMFMFEPFQSSRYFSCEYDKNNVVSIAFRRRLGANGALGLSPIWRRPLSLARAKLT